MINYRYYQTNVPLSEDVFDGIELVDGHTSDFVNRTCLEQKIHAYRHKVQGCAGA